MKSINAKVVLLGTSGVGKTSINVRYFNKKRPNKNILPTLGATFLSSKICVEDYTVILNVWDTAGQERFKAMAPMFYRDANAAIIVYDITCSHSFEQVQYWVNELNKNIESKITIFLVGNKVDLKSNRQTTFVEANEYADSIGAHYFETSALTNEGIDDLFTKLAVETIKLFQEAFYKLHSAESLRLHEDNKKNESVDEAKRLWCC